MADTPLPSMRIIYFSNQPHEVVNVVIEGLEGLGQQVLMLVTTPGTRTRASTEYQRTVTNARRDLDIQVMSQNLLALFGGQKTAGPVQVHRNIFWADRTEVLLANSVPPDTSKTSCQDLLCSVYIY